MMVGIIRIGELTTCGIIDGGKAVRLDAQDDSGGPVSVRVPFAQAESLAMTLPRLLTAALRSQTGSQSSRFVFPLGQWIVERAKDHHSLIVTLKTDDGFEVSFSVPFEIASAFGAKMKHGADVADAQSSDDGALRTAKLN